MTISVSAQRLQLFVHDGAAAVSFYTAAFEAVERYRECLLDGQVLHAEIAVGQYVLHINPRLQATDGAADTEPFTLECEDPERVLSRSLAAGAEVRETVVRDPSGYRWLIAARAAGAADRHNARSTP